MESGWCEEWGWQGNKCRRMPGIWWTVIWMKWLVMNKHWEESSTKWHEVLHDVSEVKLSFDGLICFQYLHPLVPPPHWSSSVGWTEGQKKWHVLKTSKEKTYSGISVWVYSYIHSKQNPRQWKNVLMMKIILRWTIQNNTFHVWAYLKGAMTSGWHSKVECLVRVLNQYLRFWLLLYAIIHGSEWMSNASFICVSLKFKHETTISCYKITGLIKV